MGKQLGIAVLACAFSACSLVIDTDGLSGASPTTSMSGDGAAPTDADADPLALVDASPPEASPEDARPRDAVAEAAASPCAASHLFCDDFDTGVLVGRWDRIETTAGPLTLDSAAFVSPSRSLLASIQPQPGINVRASAIQKVVGIPAKRARFAIDFLTPGPGAGTFEQVDLVGMYLSPLPAGYTVQQVVLHEAGDGIMLERFTDGSGGPSSTNKPLLLARDRWVHLVFEADFSKVPAVASLTVDGVVAATHVLFGSDLDAVTIFAGAGFVNSANVAWPLWYDNAIVDP